MEPSEYETVSNLPLVREVLESSRRADIVITPLAAPDPEKSTIVRQGLSTPDEIHDMKARGAVGEIAGQWWFDRAGNLVERPRARPVGLGIEGLERILHNGGRVLAVVAGSEERILPLRVALEKPFVNVVVTDHITALALLKD